MSKISENTVVPISLILSLVGGIFWLSTLYVKQESEAKEIIDLKASVSETNTKTEKYMLDIVQRLSRIEEAVGRH